MEAISDKQIIDRNFRRCYIGGMFSHLKYFGTPDIWAPGLGMGNIMLLDSQCRGRTIRKYTNLQIRFPGNAGFAELSNATGKSHGEKQDSINI